MKRIGLLAMLGFAQLPSTSVAAFEASQPQRGVVLTPRNFPKHTGEDVVDMLARAQQIGSFAVIRLDWSGGNAESVAESIVMLCEQYQLASVLELTPTKLSRKQKVELSFPESVSKSAGRKAGFGNPVVADAFLQTAGRLAELKPDYLSLGSDVNLLAEQQPEEYEAFVRLYQRAYAEVKKRSAETRVFVSFQWDAIVERGVSSAEGYVDDFGRALDVLAISSDPSKRYEKGGPPSIPNDYYAKIATLERGPDRVMVQVGWPSSGKSGEKQQKAFVDRLPSLLPNGTAEMIVWNFLHDVKILIFTARAGLIESDGKAKPAFDAFARGSRTEAPSAPPPTVTDGSGKGDLFGIFTATVSGKDVHQVVGSSWQQMTHPRVSPDGKLITFTRYREKNRDGVAIEKDGYANTEIMLMRVDGTQVETLVPAKKGVLNCNSTWTEDGESLVWLTTDNSKRQPQIKRMELSSRKVSRVPTPEALKTTDPHVVGDQIVFPVVGDDVDSIWIMNLDGRNPRQLTHPQYPQKQRRGLHPPGDYDPKLSPDRKSVAFMRLFGADGWRIIIVDVESGEERDLSGPERIDALPDWSSDGALLLFWHVDKKTPSRTGIYTMKPDGSDRRQVPVPRGYLHGHPHFFPGSSAAPDTKIIYQVIRAPQLP
jgi:Tol biopolymer transport system component